MKRVLAALSLTAAVLACEPARPPVEPGAGPVSSAIQVAADDTLLVVAAEDHDQLLIVDRDTKQVVRTVDLESGPSQVLVDSRGKAVVTARYGNVVHVVDVKTGEVQRTIEVGVEPTGLAEISAGKVAVALSGEAGLAVVDLVEGTVEKTIALPSLDPRAVAILADGTAYVTHMSDGKISRVDLATGEATAFDANTENRFGPRLQAEHMRSITVAPDTDAVLVAHTQANTDTVRAPIGDDGFDDGMGGGGCGGYGGCPQEMPAVAPGITEIDTTTDVVIVPEPGAPSGENGDTLNRDMGMADCFDCGAQFFGSTPNPPSVLNPFEPRLGAGSIPLNNPTAIALIDGGRGQLVVNMGSKNALIMRRDLRGTADDVVGFVNVGNGAIGLALSSDGTKAYVWNQFDATITEIEVPDMGEDLGGASKFVPDADGKPVTAEFKEVPELAATTFQIVDDALPADASLGRKLFHDATDTRIAQNRNVSCATCHPDGRADGRTWQFTFGPRNTPQLGGGILDTAPFHWPGDVVDVPDLNRLTVLPFMGGTGLDQASFTKVAAFIDLIPAAPSKAAKDGLSDAARRGRTLFEDATVGCTECHSGGDFTDNRNHDVLTKSDFRDISTFQTPVLHGLNRSAPYLHDGSQRTLEDLVQNVVATDRMGKGSHLTQAELADLTEYLKSL
jgi:DNA-binding beta-propeller fold protein YncE/mono/diheme cytochrome c family protein